MIKETFLALYICRFVVSFCGANIEMNMSYADLEEKSSIGVSSSAMAGSYGKVFKVYAREENLVLNNDINLSVEKVEGWTPIAMKVLKNKMSAGNLDNALFKEAEFMISLYDKTNGKISPRIYRCGITKDNIGFIAMEQGVSDLFHMILKKDHCGYKLKKRLDVYMKLMGAVAVLHEQSIAHCDIKLQNFVASATEDKFMLIDFGLSSSSQSCKKGTPEYLAPEIGAKSIPRMTIVPGTVRLKKEEPEDPLRFMVDIYSLGVIFAEMETIFLKCIGFHNKDSYYGINKRDPTDFHNAMKMAMVIPNPNDNFPAEIKIPSSMVVDYLRKLIENMVADVPASRSSAAFLYDQIGVLKDLYKRINKINGEKREVRSETVAKILEKLSQCRDSQCLNDIYTVINHPHHLGVHPGEKYIDAGYGSTLRI